MTLPNGMFSIKAIVFYEQNHHFLCVQVKEENCFFFFPADETLEQYL